MFVRVSVTIWLLSQYIFNVVLSDEIDQTPVIGKRGIKCYDAFNRPQWCIPEFENAAYKLLMEATNTCGDQGPIEYCIQTGILGTRRSCDVCYPGQHSSTYLTDFHSLDNQTWWQSETMLQGIQFPSQVNLTLHLGKSFDITYIRLVFYSPRPESFALYKRTCEECPWIPYQFYSASCRDTYDLPDSTATRRGEETRALCTSEYSDISPLTGGNIAFSTLEGRPSAYSFDTSPELHEWVTATDLLISLDRLNTFGDEVFGDERVLRSYFYAIADVAVGARCKCNGHASQCVTASSVDGSTRRVCRCEHNTAGPDCNECLPFYNDVPWRRASAKNAHECKACNCNGFSTRCFFDKELYEKTGHGGHCLDCAANRDGPHCERCRENYYTREDGYCIACDCDPVGSRSLQCNSQGHCQCKPGVTGDKCDRCDVNYFEFGNHGCKHCGCSEQGSLSNTPDCDPISGSCRCKENVEGKQCRECKPGYFNLDFENEFGCTPCFCYGHSSECAPAPGYSRYQIESIFSKSTEKWRAEDEKGRPIEVHYDGLTQRIGVSAPPDDAVYFLAPERFLGNQKASYNQLLQFTLSIGENRPVPTATDIILEGAGSYVTNTIFAQRNPIPAVQKQQYKFRLHEHPNYGWQPRLSARNFMSVLSNLTAIRIKGTYANGGVGFLDDVKLETASRGVAGRPAQWVEMCQCPDGYVGQFCESCAPGYRHSPSHGGPFSPCIPCDCNKHADICDSETGLCICQHNTAGDNCDRCARGYYGNALAGTPYDCQPCGCPEGGACLQLNEDIIMCIECPTGYTGHRCDSCSDGYFGDPTGRYGPTQPCQLCECNLNIDTNAVGNCNTTTGECLKCIHNTGGPHCDQCLPGYYGDALALPKGDCEPCQCYSVGTEERPDGISECDPISGECRCKSHVKGRNCDQCEDGYYNIVSGEGCQLCNCDPIGSLNHTCDLYTGQCHCRPGITGLRCDRCEDYKYGFSSEGCKACECDLIGSRGPQCDMFGQCPCLDNVEGNKCDRCKENKYDRKRGCVDCPDCYNLVQNASRNHLVKLARLAKILDEIERDPTVNSDKLFEKQLRAIQDEIEDLLDQARTGTGGDEENLTVKLNNIEDRQKAIARTLSEIAENTQLALDRGEIAKSNVSYTEDSISLAKKELEGAWDILQTAGKNALENAQERAREFGQQSDKMTNIAQEARKTADDLDEYAEAIVKTATDAKNKSIEAYDLAKNATDLQRNINQDVKKLRNDVDETEARLNRIKNWTEDTQNKAIEAKKDALSLLNVVYNYVIPAIDIPALKSQAEEVKNEAERLSNETDKLQQQNDDLLNDINEQVIVAEDLLQKGIEQQDTTNDLLSEIDLAKAQAESAVTLGDETLKEATATYETLSHFDKQVKESKAAAKQAIQQIPEIQQLIDDASNKANEAEISLRDAKFNADNALRTVTQADNLAKVASEKAQQIKAEAEQLYQNATGFKQEANLMADRVDNTEMEYRELYKQTQSNETLIGEAKDKVGRAGKDSQEAAKKVNDILKDVEDIMRELENLPQLDDSDLQRLEAELVKAEQRVQEANLDKILEDLRMEHKKQNALVDAYRDEIERLRKEVENVREISEALPDKCFKRVELEP